MPVGEWIEALRGFDFWGAVTGWWSGVSAWFAERWAEVKAAVPVGEWIEALRGFSLLDAGRDWINGLWDGIREVWQELKDWFSTVVGELFGLLPEFVRVRLGIDGADGAPAAQTGAQARPIPAGGAAPHPALAPPHPTLAPPHPTLFGSTAPAAPRGTAPGAPAEAHVSGAVHLVIDDERTRVRELRADNPDFDLTVDMGRVLAY